VTYSSRAGVAKRGVSRSVVVVGASDVGAVLMLSGGAYGAANAPHAVISPRYQAKTAYPILGGAPARPTAEASLLRGGQHTWRGPAFPRRRGITAAIGSINCGPKFAIARELLSLPSRQGVLMDYLPDQRADRGADPSSEHDIGAARTVSTPRTHGTSPARPQLRAVRRSVAMEDAQHRREAAPQGRRGGWRARLPTARRADSRRRHASDALATARRLVRAGAASGCCPLRALAVPQSGDFEVLRASPPAPLVRPFPQRS